MFDSRQYGITFAGKHSFRDFGLRVIDKKIDFPKKDKVTITLPYSSQLIDLSELYDETSYGERSLEVTFLVIDQEQYSKDVIYNKMTSFVNYLEQTHGKIELIDDIMPEYYYLAELVDAPKWNEDRHHGKFTAKFSAYPFRIRLNPEGSDIWDEFSFENDVAQNIRHVVNKNYDFILINVGVQAVQPVVVASSEFVLTVNGVEYAVKSGITDPIDAAYPVTLPVGENKLHVIGTGTIEFDWHKEVI